MLPDSLQGQLAKDYKPFFEKHRNFITPRQHMIDSEEGFYKDVKLRTMKGFGYEWKNFSKLFDIYEKQFLNWIYPIPPSFFEGKLVLDAGCGVGRHLFHATKFGAETIGIDLSESVDVAYANTKSLAKAHLLQADIYHLPFRENQFDYVYCIGVLHHLPKPQQGFNGLIKVLKSQGTISAWVYGREGNIPLKILNPMRKYLFSKIPIQLTELSSYLMMLFIYPVVKLVYKPLNKNQWSRKLADAVLPQNPFFNYLANFNFEINHSILFDQLLAPIAYYYKREEFEKWFLEAPLQDVKISWRNKNSWRGYARKI